MLGGYFKFCIDYGELITHGYDFGDNDGMSKQFIADHYFHGGKCDSTLHVYLQN